MSIIFTETISGATVTLRNPELQDTLKMSGGTNISRTMTNKLRTSIISKKLGKMFEMSFTDIKQTDIDLLIIFLTTNNGKQIQMTYYDGVVYTGYILTDPIDIIRTSYIYEPLRTSDYFTSFTLTFEQS